MFHSRRNREYWNACKEVQTYEEIDIQEVPLSSPIFKRRVEAFLAANGLRFEEVDSYYVLLDREGEIIAGAGLHNDVIKCVAVDSAARSGGFMTPLISHVINIAAAQGITNLKVFTKPENEGIFRSLGFHLIASAPKAILMENGHGLEDYLRTLSAAGQLSQPDRGSTSSPSAVPEPSLRIHELSRRVTAAEYGLSPASDPATGVIVMNANPFTLGHQYLVRKASEAVDRLFIIPVKDDSTDSFITGNSNQDGSASFSGVPFPYEERLAMMKAGCGDLATVLEGSSYQISDITFPTYFLKDLSDASETQIRLDLDLFGRHIAPALGATVRFVGSEPSDPLTARYNELMKEILPTYGISVVEIPRLSVDVAWSAAELRPYSAAAKREWTRPSSDVSQAVKPVCASEVRDAISAGCFMKAAGLTPLTTWPYLAAELMTRALRMELDAPVKPGLVDPASNGAHTDMDYNLMLGSIKVIRSSFARHYSEAILSSVQALSDFGKAIEADVLDFTGGVNTYRGAIFSLGLALVSALEILGGAQPFENEEVAESRRKKIATPCLPNLQTINHLCTTFLDRLSSTISQKASQILEDDNSHGSRAVNEYGVKGALQMAREGYRPLFEDWLPYYRSLTVVPSGPVRVHPRSAAAEYGLSPAASTAGTLEPWRLQKTLLRIMSQLDDTCVIHRAGYERAQRVKEEAESLLENFTPEALRIMKGQYDIEGISPGGAADMLALTILVDSLSRGGLPEAGAPEQK